MASQFHFHRQQDTTVAQDNPSDRPRSPHRWVYYFWPAFYGIMLLVLIVLVLAQLARAGGPHYVAGVSYFDPSTKGEPLTWSPGAISYYTDQGDLSSALPHASADAFVADAFSRWTGIPTAALAAANAGQLAEDVSGQNVIVNSDGSISMPTDILPSATGKPVAIVYDAGGQVTDALLGQGAGGIDYCFTNAVFGGPDNLTTDAHIVHALVILNGNCAQTSNQLSDLKYRLVRVLGRTLGLDWSQANVNVFTRNPIPTSDDFAGLTIMHAIDQVSCIPISVCIPNADQPKMDDRAAISRLYSVTSQNVSNFPGKQLFNENRVRIHGAVRFVDADGQPAQPMQGANVVARWIDPNTGKASRAWVSTSVSGFLFHGNAGNPVTGSLDGTGQAYDRFGSDDAAVEGFFDLAGLEIPDGSNGARYELTVEAVDPLWSQTVGPYGPWQVQPSGAAQPIQVTVSKGGDVQQDLVIGNSMVEVPDPFVPEDFSTPAPVPPAGEWVGTLSGYGDSDYLRFTGQANRSLTIEVTALDEAGNPSETKSLPVIGMWALSDPPGTIPGAASPMAFNTGTFALTRINANLLTSTDFRIGISDFRGDGRPDYRYQAHVLYGDSVTPTRASVAGGTPIGISGLGFRKGLSAGVGPASAPVLAVTPSLATAVAPGMPDGIQSLALSDPGGASALMTNVLTYGAGPSDTLRLLIGSNPATPVGGEAPNPILVQVVDQTGTVPVAGASVVFTSSPSASLSACAGASSCTVLSDLSGQASTRVTILSKGTITISAVLAPASYINPKTVQATILGTASALDLVAFSPYSFVSQGATLDLPLKTRVLSQGVGLNGKTINYYISKGSGTVNPATSTSNSQGYSTSTLHIAGMSGDVEVSACVEPGDVPCTKFKSTSVPQAQLQLQPVSGTAQIITNGQTFLPLKMRVTDGSTAANPVAGSTVSFEADAFRPTNNESSDGGGDSGITHDPVRVLISSTKSSAVSAIDGTASFQPAAGYPGCAADIEILASTSAFALQYEWQALWPQGAISQREDERESNQHRRGNERTSE